MMLVAGQLSIDAILSQPVECTVLGQVATDMTAVKVTTLGHDHSWWTMTAMRSVAHFETAPKPACVCELSQLAATCCSVSLGFRSGI